MSEKEVVGREGFATELVTKDELIVRGAITQNMLEELGSLLVVARVVEAFAVRRKAH